MPNTEALSQLNIDIFSPSGMARTPASVDQQQMQRDPASQQNQPQQNQQQQQPQHQQPSGQQQESGEGM
jgi:hypothetical protein